MTRKSSESEAHSRTQQSRRDFICKAAYTAPVLLTLPAAPSFAQQGSASGSTDPGGTDTGGTDPGTGPTPVSQINCNDPLQPIDSDSAANMCQLTFDQDAGETYFQDIIVSQDAVPGRLAQGDLLGTCDSFLCNAS